MYNNKVIAETIEFVKIKFQGEGSGHDWWHIYRVWKSSIYLAEKEGADLYIVELAALLHDIADWKFHNGDESIGPQVAGKWLRNLGVDEQTINHVCDIIKNLSFKGAKVASQMSSLEGMVVQDADRLDAIGAIGIARTFAYGGHKGREMYNPEIEPKLHENFEHYKKDSGPTINHFYEKLLLLKDIMNTKTAYDLAKERHDFMEDFLKQFYREWESKY